MREEEQRCAAALLLWNEALADVRAQHHVMQCFYGRQLVVLMDWLCSNDVGARKESEALLKFASSQGEWQELHPVRRNRLRALRTATKKDLRDAEAALTELAQCLSSMAPPASGVDAAGSQARRDLSVPVMSLTSHRAVVVTVPPEGNIISAIGAVLYVHPLLLFITVNHDSRIAKMSRPC